MNKKTGWERDAKLVLAGEWAGRISQIASPSVRGKIASMVLWDFFGDSVNAPQELKELVACYNGNVDLTVEQVTNGLVAIGYPAEVAVAKANVSRQFANKLVVVDDQGARNEGLLSRNSTGENAVVCAICEKSIADVRTLVAAGVVLPDCSIRADWPPKNYNGISGYSSRTDVKELIDFVMDGPLERLMEGMGIEHEIEDVWDAIGLTGEKQVA